MGKNIALFIDGTWNDAGGSGETNVHLLSQRVADGATTNPAAQVFHYIEGVGTEKRTRNLPAWLVAARLKKRPKLLHRVVANLAGGVAGYGTASRIKEAYAYLVEHYKDGDGIFLFGFSRGAFAVRSLAGFVSRVGLLLQKDIAHVEEAYLAYEAGGNLNRVLRRLGLPVTPDLESRTVLPIHMIGVWDTVARLGVPSKLQVLRRTKTGFHATGIPDYVSHVRHALALHEVRPTFEPLLWEDRCGPRQTLKQVWFPGAHADVGGGYPDGKDAIGRSLSDIALEWMACEARQLGLVVGANTKLPDVAKMVEVHHEVRGKFFYVIPGVRRFLKGVFALPAEDLSSHRMHLSATHRLLNLPPGRYPLFRFDVADTLQDIDELTGTFSMKLAYELGVGPLKPVRCDLLSDEDRYVTRPSQSVPTGLSAETWRSLSVGEVVAAKELVERLIGSPKDIQNVELVKVSRSISVLAAFGEDSILIDLGDCASRFASAVHSMVDPDAIEGGLNVLRCFDDAVNLGHETYSLPWADLARAVHTRMACEHVLLQEHASRSRSEQRRRILVSRAKKFKL